MFSNLNKPAFGSTTANTSFGFGTSTAANANPFGQNQLFAKPNTGGFGNPSTSTFGQPANTSLFPSNPPQSTNLFQNAGSTFGAPQTAQTGGFGSNLFGQQQPSTSGLFNNSSTFGQNKPTGFGFGTTQTQPSLFGQQPQPNQTSNLFQPSSANLFGGGSAFGGQQSGTVLKFNPVTGTDTMMKNGVAQSINTKHHSITCMKEYENKSFEELRYEDYQVNRKGPQQQAGFGTPSFGATASSAPSLFGQPDASKPAFGQATGFGQTTSTFGQPSTGFGLTNQANTSSNLFSKPTGFGVPSSSTSTFGFNSTPNANPFGANTTAKPFGSTAQPLFGTSTAQPTQTGFGTSLFGQTNNQNSMKSLFGKPTQPTTGFNQTQNTGFSFNPPASTQGSTLFQNNKPTLFGQPSMGTTGFGQTNTFGQAGQSTFGGFGSTTTPSFGQTNQMGGFGATLGATQPQMPSLFGNAAPKPTGLFGNTGTTGMFGNQTSSFPLQTSSAFGIQSCQPPQSLFPAPDQGTEYKNLALIATDPFGDAPHLAGLEPKTRTDPSPAVATNPAELKSLLDVSKKVDTSHNSKLKMFPLKSLRETLFDGIHKPEADGLPQAASNNCRRLILKPKNINPTSSPSGNSEISTEITNSLMGGPSFKNDESLNLENNESESKSSFTRLTFDPTQFQAPPIGIPDISIQTQTLLNKSSEEKQNSKNDSPPPSDDEEIPDPLASGDTGKNINPCRIISTRPEYYTLPRLEELAQYTDENGACLVKGFTIGRKGYGNVYFPDEMDVAGLNIDELVHFRYREINVYPDESKKPPVGQGLNRKAQVTLDNVYPRQNGTNTLIKDINELLQMNFAEKLLKITVKKNAKFIDYRPETGSWVFKVDHFSKYGFNDSDEDTEQNGEKKKEKTDGAQKPKLNVVNVDNVAKEAEKVEKITDTNGENVKFGLDKEIYIDDEDDQSGSEEDILAQAMYVDMSEEDFPNLPPHMPTNLQLHSSFDTYKTSKSIQVMKSTLFGDDDRSSDGGSSHASIIKQYLDLPDELPKALPVIREEVPIQKRPILRPKVDKVYNFFENEVDCGVLPSSTYSDMAAFKGKSFKVGWHKGFTFINLNSKSGEITLNSIGNNDVSKFSDPLQDCLTDSLKIVLGESSCELDNENIPTFNILKSNSYLQKQTDLFHYLIIKFGNKEANYLYSIWTLCTALWGSSEDNMSNRRYLLSEWLKHVTAYKFNVSTESNGPIFSLLTVFKIFEAASLAMDKKCPNLSLIISQLCVSNRTKLFLQEQIESWYNSMTANHISDDLKKVYLLLAGIPTKEDINIFDSIDWKRAFGMHLWYVCPNGASVEMAIELYKNAFETGGYAEKPIPPYCNSFSEDQAFDILYHILLLYRTRIHRLSSTLEPATHTNDPLDYRLSWLLLQLFLSLDIGLIEESEKNKITTSFSNQLESLGEWEWAIYVVLYLKDNILKKTLVMGILDRNLSPDIDKNSIETQNRLVNDMNIPPEWIHIVKGQKTLLLGRYYEAFNHFAHARNYIKANEIMIEHLIPGLFINEQYDIIKIMIDSISPGSRDILRWNYEAGLFVDFLELQEKVFSARPEDILRLQTKLQSISDRIGAFPMKTDQQKLCIAEIAKRSASIYKELCIRDNQTSIVRILYSDFIDSLEMPPDFKQSEALYLISNR